VTRDAERPSNEAVQRLFELSLDMLGTSRGSYFTELNPAWEHWLGWTREELMAVPFMSFVHPDDAAATRERGSAFPDPDADAVFTHENRYRTRAGDYRYLNWTTVSVDGVLYFAARDVTDRKARESEEDEAERLIRHSEALHRTLTANLPDPGGRGRGDPPARLPR
jgi:PAS domain S-box-containing protein